MYDRNACLISEKKASSKCVSKRHFLPGAIKIHWFTSLCLSVSFCWFLGIIFQKFLSCFDAVLYSKVSARKPVYGESADHSTHGSKLRPRLTRVFWELTWWSGCIFVSAVAVRENVWEPLKLGLISGYLRVFSFFISTGLWAPHLMWWHSLLLYLGSPCKISPNHCLDTF